MALTKDKVIKITTGGATRVGEADAAADAVIYKGAALSRNAAGFVAPSADTASTKVIGFAEEAVNNTGGANGAKTVKYITGVTAQMKNAAGAIVQASKHTTCCVSDDESVTTAAVATNDIIVGTVVAFTTTLVDVYVDERANA